MQIRQYCREFQNICSGLNVPLTPFRLNVRQYQRKSLQEVILLGDFNDTSDRSTATITPGYQIPWTLHTVHVGLLRHRLWPCSFIYAPVKQSVQLDLSSMVAQKYQTCIWGSFLVMGIWYLVPQIVQASAREVIIPPRRWNDYPSSAKKLRLCRLQADRFTRCGVLHRYPMYVPLVRS